MSKWERGQKVWYFPQGGALRATGGIRKRPAIFLSVNGKRYFIQLLTEDGPGIVKYVSHDSVEERTEELPVDDIIKK